MFIQEFWAKNFRSLRDVHLKDLGKFNIFYGPNGSGKSNVLKGMELLFRLAEARSPFSVGDGLVQAHPWEGVTNARERQDGLGVDLGTSPLHAASADRKVVLGAQIIEAAQPEAGPFPIEVEVDFGAPANPPWVRITRLGEYTFDADAPTKASGGPDRRAGTAHQTMFEEASRRFYRSDLPPRRPHLVDAPRFEVPAEALLDAKNSPNWDERGRFRLVQDFLAGPTPPFGPFEVVIKKDERTRRPTVVRPFGASPKDELPLSAAGLGAAQVYSILAEALLHPGQPIAIEEPEAHLHAPTTGRALRQLLRRAVDEGHVEQFFISTHSNLFDLDETGYWDVKLVDGATVIARQTDLVQLHLDHLWEPGAASRALAAKLQRLPPAQIYFVGSNGSQVSVGELLAHLQADDAVAKEYLDSFHRALVSFLADGGR